MQQQIDLSFDRERAVERQPTGSTDAPWLTAQAGFSKRTFLGRGYMVWFWTRDSQELKVETRYDNDTLEFVVTVESVQGIPKTERFKNMDDFRNRLIELEEHLEADRWKNTGPPLLIPEGFPHRRLT